MSIMIDLERILENLRDTNWHSLDEIGMEIYLQSDRLNQLVLFLQKLAFVSKKDSMLRITNRGLKFLDL